MIDQLSSTYDEKRSAGRPGWLMAARVLLHAQANLQIATGPAPLRPASACLARLQLPIFNTLCSLLNPPLHTTGELICRCNLHAGDEPLSCVPPTLWSDLISFSLRRPVPSIFSVFLFLFLFAFPTGSRSYALMISTLQRMSLAAILDRIIERFEDVLDG